MTKFVSTADPDIKVLVVGAIDGGQILSSVELSAQTKNVLCNAIQIAHSRGRFNGKIGETLDILAPAGFDDGRIFVCGVTGPEPLRPIDLQKIGGEAIAAIARSGETAATIAIPPAPDTDLEDHQWTANLAFGAMLRNYKFMVWRDGLRPGEPVFVERVQVISSRADMAERFFSRYRAIAAGVFLARDLTVEPGNVVYPQVFVDRVTELTSFGIEVEALGPEKIKSMGLNGILAVGGASVNRERLLVLKWRGAGNGEAPPIALVGKGVTYDTGGLNLKSLARMTGMKGDMAGGAAVVGAICALAQSAAKANVVGVVPLVENAISGSALRPSDIIRMGNGTTLEITNPDSEGRIILSDALHFACKCFDPAVVLDIGTLSGSGPEGLGRHYGALYTEDAELRQDLINAGREVSEPLWSLPTDERFDRELRSDIADLKLMADDKYGADGSYIYRLLRYSVGPRRWGHIDMCFLEAQSEDSPTCPKGPTGYAVRLFEQFVWQNQLQAA